MEFREITLSDYDNLIPFWKENYFVSDMDSKDRFALFLDKNPRLSLLAKENEKIIATALGSFDGRRGYLQKVVVNQKYRGQGIGKKITEMVMGKLKSLGAVYVPISVEENLVEFYKNCGFKTTDQISMSIDL